MRELTLLTDDIAIAPYLNQLFSDAIQTNTSDIHIEPFQDYCQIRFRQDGHLHSTQQLSNSFAQRLILSIKMSAQLNITERRLPQDGRLYVQQRDCRISSCPTLYGEKLVIRLQPDSNHVFPLNELGMTDEQQKVVLSALSLPQGLILITGPTGSGKTMTLYTAISQLNMSQKNIITIEDPIEISLNGITQVHLNTQLGFNVPTVLRHILRQDPDVLMIGEIRDSETAALAIHAAQTGHLVLASLHTNSIETTLLRLQALGIKHEYLKETVTLISSQRLLRKCCSHCFGNFTTCDHCHDGFCGRLGIFEIKSFTNNHTNMTLHDAANHLVNTNITTTEEVNRVLGKQENFA